MRRLLLLLACSVLVASPAALAHPPGPTLGVVIEALRTVPVSYNTESGFTELEADAISRRLTGSNDVAVGLVAPSAIMVAGPEATARDVAAHLDDDRVYVIASGGRLGAWGGTGDRDEIRALVRQARVAHRGQPNALAVSELAGLLAERARQDRADDAPAWLWPAVAVGSLLVLLLAAVALRARRPRAGEPASSRP